ncbi:MAG TPA: hypothetical protein VFW37_14290 [Alphaproteobacteria bacterium]|nr:hypothetical protein [Alphaproteobacteria bacterium]
MLRIVLGYMVLLMAGVMQPVFAQSVSSGLIVAQETGWVDLDLVNSRSEDPAGLHLLAKNVRDDAPTAMAVGWHREGVGASGAQASAPAIKAETGFDPVENRSEQIIIQFDQPVTQTDIDVDYFHRDEGAWGGVSYHERGGWRAYRGGALVGEGLFLPGQKGGAHQIRIAAPQPFDRLELFATPYVTETGAEIEPGLITSDSSDFLIKHIAYRPVSAVQPIAVR